MIVVACPFSKAGSWETATEMLGLGIGRMARIAAKHDRGNVHARSGAFV